MKKQDLKIVVVAGSIACIAILAALCSYIPGLSTAHFFSDYVLTGGMLLIVALVLLKFRPRMLG